MPNEQRKPRATIRCRDELVSKVVQNQSMYVGRRRKPREKKTYGLERAGTRAPADGIVSENDLEGEIDQDGQGQVLLAESLLEQLQGSDGVVGNEANLGGEKN